MSATQTFKAVPDELLEMIAATQDLILTTATTFAEVSKSFTGIFLACLREPDSGPRRRGRRWARFRRETPRQPEGVLAQADQPLCAGQACRSIQGRLIRS